MEITRYQRKPQYVQAVRVTNDNFLDVVAWCQGSIVTPGQTFSLDRLREIEDKYIQVRVNNPMKPKHSRAYVGDWVLYSEYKGYQVYTQGAFKNAFDRAPEEKSVEQAVEELAAKNGASGELAAPSGHDGRMA